MVAEPMRQQLQQMKIQKIGEHDPPAVALQRMNEMSEILANLGIAHLDMLGNGGKIENALNALANRPYAAEAEIQTIKSATQQEIRNNTTEESWNARQY